jgi:putative FmdB family regulatory protein
MPLYGFDCRSCKHEFETIVSGSVEAGERCPACGSTDTKREDFPRKPPLGIVNGASAANNYGLRPKNNRK